MYPDLERCYYISENKEKLGNDWMQDPGPHL